MLEMNNDTLKWGGLASAIVGFLMLWTAVR